MRWPLASSLIPQRQCENFARAGEVAQAAAAAATGVLAYPRSTLARLCLLTSITRIPNIPVDSVIAVAQAILTASPTNPIALEYLADALETRGDRAAAGSAWTRLLATDSLNEALIERVVTAMARDGNAPQAQLIIDRASEAHPKNVALLRLRWLRHLATSDWKERIAVGEAYLEGQQRRDAS